MSRFRLFLIVVTVLIVGAGGYLYWFSQTHNSFLELLNVLQPGPDEAPPTQPTTPIEPPVRSEAEGTEAETDLTLVEKTLRVPSQFDGVDPFSQPRVLQVPRAAEISVFAAGFRKERFMAVSPSWWPAGEGILYITDAKADSVYALPDRDGDGVADEVVEVARGMDFPHGIVFHDGALWVVTTTTVRKFFDDDGDLRAERSELVIDNLPPGGNHVSRTIAFDAQGRLYVSIGSSCNVCEDDPRRAAILRFNADGSGEEVFASGLRNGVGIVFDANGELWETENGRDLIGDDVPPEEINIVREGRHYGWPYCYAEGIVDTTFKKRTRLRESIESFCASTQNPAVQFQAHTAPLGLRFLDDERIPEAIRGDLLVALHGSWNRTVPVGYEIIRVSGLPENPELTPFVTGFLEPNQSGLGRWGMSAKAWGRPVDVIVGADGAIYISDDAANAVYRLAF